MCVCVCVSAACPAAQDMSKHYPLIATQAQYSGYDLFSHTCTDEGSGRGQRLHSAAVCSSLVTAKTVAFIKLYVAALYGVSYYSITCHVTEHEMKTTVCVLLLLGSASPVVSQESTSRSCPAGFLPSFEYDSCWCGAGRYPGILACCSDAGYSGNTSGVIVSSFDLEGELSAPLSLGIHPLNNFYTATLPPFFSPTPRDGLVYPSSVPRVGTMLAACPNGTGVSVTDRVSCTDCSDLHPALSLFIFLLVEYVPLIALFTIITLFNINLTSGPAHSFVFFYQSIVTILRTAFGPIFSPILTTLGSGRFIWGFLLLENPLHTFLPLYCLVNIDSTLALQTVQCGKVAVLILLIFLLLSPLMCPCSCQSLERLRVTVGRLRRAIRHFREKYAFEGSIVIGISSIILLSFNKVVQITGTIFARSSVHVIDATNNALVSVDVFRLNGAKEYACTNEGVCIVYFTLGSVILFSSMLVPLLLLYYPAIPALFQMCCKRSLPHCAKLVPFFDAFQSAYKPKFRFFAGVYLLYRVALWTIDAAHTSPINRTTYYVWFFLTILLIHCTFQPFQQLKHNRIETFYFLLLTFMASFAVVYVFKNSVIAEGKEGCPRAIARPNISFESLGIRSEVAIFLISWLPMLLVCIYSMYRCVLNHRAKNSQEREDSRFPSNNSVVEQEQQECANVRQQESAIHSNRMTSVNVWAPHNYFEQNLAEEDL